MILLAGLATSVTVAGANVPRVAGSDVLLESDKGALSISLLCPSFVFDAGTVGGAAPLSIKGSLSRREGLEVSYAAQPIGGGGRLKVRLLVQWQSGEGVLHKWAEFRIADAPTAMLLKEVVLDRVGVPGEKPQLEGSGVQSYPAFWRGFFAAPRRELPAEWAIGFFRRLLAAATCHRGRFIWAPMLRALIIIRALDSVAEKTICSPRKPPGLM